MKVGGFAVVYSFYVVASIVCGGLVLGPFLFRFAVLYVILNFCKHLTGKESWSLYFCCVLNVVPLLSYIDSSSLCSGFVCSM